MGCSFQRTLPQYFAALVLAAIFLWVVSATLRARPGRAATAWAAAHLAAEGGAEAVVRVDVEGKSAPHGVEEVLRADILLGYGDKVDAERLEVGATPGDVGEDGAAQRAAHPPHDEDDSWALMPQFACRNLAAIGPRKQAGVVQYGVVRSAVFSGECGRDRQLADCGAVARGGSLDVAP